MVCTLNTSLEFCYLVCRDVITTSMLAQIEDALACFHEHHIIFEKLGVWSLDGLLLPLQHLMMHYPYLIQLFGAPNGLCSLITESKHIKAVKEPYRHSNHYKALGQMLLTNQCLDKLTASCANFSSCGMLQGSCIRAAEDNIDIWAGLGLEDAGVHDLADLIEIHATVHKDDNGGPLNGDFLGR